MSDSATLLAYLNENAQPDGSFSQNAQTTAALIGFYPEQLSDAFQALVADGSIEATHAGGDPAKIHGSSWRVVAVAAAAAEAASADDLDGLKVPALRKRAAADGVDIKGLNRKADIVAALRAAAGSPPADDTPVDLLSHLDSAELTAFANERGIELPEHSFDDEDEPPSEAELRQVVQAALDQRALDDAANGRLGGDAA